MISPNLTYFDIDLADIWEHELYSYDTGSEIPFAFYHGLYLDLQTLFIQLGHKPYLSHESIKAGKHKIDYYQREHARLEQREENHLFKIFERCESLYDMTTPCLVKRRKINKLAYQKLFALKLSQYKEGLVYLRNFLIYHFKKTFQMELDDYSEFIRLTLDQWTSMIDQKVAEETREIMSSLKSLPSKKTRKKTNEKQDSNTSVNFKVPTGYELVPGKLTKNEIKKCFSFLYMEKSNGAFPFLKKKDVSYIFRFGIAIPPDYIPVKRFKLNCSNAFPKSIIKTAIYKFFKKYATSNNQKLDIVRFFASYIDDFHKYLDSQKKLKTLAGNIPGIPSKNLKFNLDHYIEPPPVIVPDKILQPVSKFQHSRT